MSAGWFACFETEGEGFSPGYPWQAVLQLEGLMVSTGMWFRSEAECMDFIRTQVIGQPLLGAPEPAPLVDVTTLSDPLPRYVLGPGTREALIAMGWDLPAGTEGD
ncbi:hypothetical protein ACWGB8_07870 [Kitasatospora sp. NPDC054939]